MRFDSTQHVWDRFYGWKVIWQRSACTPTLRARIAFIFLSKLYRQMYAGTGISTDSARRKKSQKWARWTARQCKRLFKATPMPDLPQREWHMPIAGTAFPGASAAMSNPLPVLPDN